MIKDDIKLAYVWEFHADSLPISCDEIAVIVGEHQEPGSSGYAEEEIVGVYLLKDGRYLYISGGCDTTGWDCQSSARGEIRDSLPEIIRECCTEEDRRWLGFSLEAP